MGWGWGVGSELLPPRVGAWEPGPEVACMQHAGMLARTQAFCLRPLPAGLWPSSRCTPTAAGPLGGAPWCAPAGMTPRIASGAARRTSGSAGMASTASSAFGREWRLRVEGRE